MRPLLVLALASWVLVGCGEAQGVDPSPHPEATASDAAVRIVGEADADLVLHVSNQSFDDEEVRLTVTVDDVTIVDGEFHVEDQHNWVSFPLAMPTGGHEITAESDSGATMSEAFELPRGEMRYALIEHWTEDGSAEVTWRIQREPMAFA